MSPLLIKAALLKLYPDLTKSNLAIISYMIEKGEPVNVRELSLRTRVTRTMVYRNLNFLIAAGLAKTIEIRLEDIEIPDIWEYWTPSRQNRWRTERKLSLVQWIPDLDVIRADIMKFESQARELRVFRHSLSGGGSTL